MNQPTQPLDVVHLFPEMRAELLRVLQSLQATDWQRPTACEGWTVKDVAAHIFADDVGYLSRHRDNEGVTFVTDDFAELVALINEQNDTWVQAMRRMSTRLLLTFLQISGDELHAYLETIDPMAQSHPVSWASNAAAPMWLQIARELTEYWMHHQHVCEALDITSLKTRRFLHPVLATFVYALPRTYAAVDALDGTAIALQITGEAADTWVVLREGGLWKLYQQVDVEPTSTVILPEDAAWRLFTKAITPAQAAQQATITGDKDLGALLLNTVAILA